MLFIEEFFFKFMVSYLKITFALHKTSLTHFTHYPLCRSA